MMNFMKSTLHITKKDLYTEWKTRQTISTMLIFSALVIVVFSFAFDPTNSSMQAVTPGVIWVVIVFSSILGLNRSFLMEYKNDNLSGMLAAPIDPSSIYLGKLLANLVLVLIVELVSIPLLFLFFDFRWMGSLLYFAGTVLLGTFGFIAIGTFLAALAANSRSSEMLLPVILFPVATPVLIGAVQSTKTILTDAENISSAVSWMQFMAAYDLIFFVVCFLLFEYVVEV
ncbi:heme exporter protein CcmB [Paenibacillus sp. Dod16]|uniref:heme exporter protein CcmB n=1 Tax=Paenibacillus sp. Dod16 TaxID=3416392 RepID=UPI003CEA6DC2